MQRQFPKNINHVLICSRHSICWTIVSVNFLLHSEKKSKASRLKTKYSDNNFRKFWFHCMFVLRKLLHILCNILRMPALLWFSIICKSSLPTKKSGSSRISKISLELQAFILEFTCFQSNILPPLKFWILNNKVHSTVYVQVSPILDQNYTIWYQRI